MQIIHADEVIGTKFDVVCCYGRCLSARMLRQSHGFGFSVNLTRLEAGSEVELCYERHVEACYCLQGTGSISSDENSYQISPGTLYALRKCERHVLSATTELVLISIFDPPLVGLETHNESGSY